MTKGAASVNITCCMDTEEEDERCISVIQCDGMDNAVGSWRTPDASWLDMEEADEGQGMIIDMVRQVNTGHPGASWMRRSSKHGKSKRTLK
jgi:hypothetical protein